MDKNRLTIIIPVYNAEDYLSRCLDSVLDQDMESYEVILVDDGARIPRRSSATGIPLQIHASGRSTSLTEG